MPSSTVPSNALHTSALVWPVKSIASAGGAVAISRPRMNLQKPDAVGISTMTSSALSLVTV